MVDEQTRRARALRGEPTEAEKRLWSRLRRRQILGCRFRRQHPVGPYIVDFVCLERQLAIELDGGQHATRSEGNRTELLKQQGFEILRFWNSAVFENLEGVLDAIRERLGARGHAS